MTTTNKKEHAFKRRINVKALRPQAIEAVQDQILQNIRYFCCILVDEGKSGEWSASRNMSKVVGYLISDIMGDITFSKNWNTQRDPQNRHFVEDSTLGTACVYFVS